MVVTIIFLLFLVTNVVVVYFFYTSTDFSSFANIMLHLFERKPMLLLFIFIAMMRPAFIIHLWLPLFALSTLIARLVFWIFRAVEKAQWFLKQGDAHPLKAIGSSRPS